VKKTITNDKKGLSACGHAQTGNGKWLNLPAPSGARQARQNSRNK